MGLYCDLKLPRSLATLGQEGFEGTLLDELNECSGDLPLEDFIVEGGWPDEESLELSIESIDRRDGVVVISVRCEFDECTPTGCADIHRSSSAFGTFEVTLDPEAGTSYIEGDPY